MKTLIQRMLGLSGMWLAATTAHSAVAWSEIGTKAGAEYRGDGLSVSPAESGALLRWKL